MTEESSLPLRGGRSSATRRRCWPNMRRRAASSIEPPIPIEDIVEKHLKLGIEFDDMHRLLRRAAFRPRFDPDILGAIFFDERRIVIDESLDPEENPSKEGRYRFTLAHEGGGHWRLHRHLFAKDPAQTSLFDEPAPPSFVCRSSQAKERDRMAGGFLCLVPADAAQAGLRRLGRDVPGPQAARSPAVRRRSAIRFVEIARETDSIGDFDRSESDDEALERFARPLRRAVPRFADRHAHPAGKARAAAPRGPASAASRRWLVDPFFEESVKCQLDR